SPPASLQAATASSSFSWLRSTSARRAPRAARYSPMARPRPWPPPVMMMTLSLSSLLCAPCGTAGSCLARGPSGYAGPPSVFPRFQRGVEMSAMAAKHARELLLKEYRGMLATHSQKMPGFPFGSVVPYCLDGQGWPLLLISRIAQHTRNLRADPRCSLLVGERDAEDVQ